MYNKSRMTGDCHVRFCERFGVKLPLPTRQPNRLCSRVKKRQQNRKMRQKNMKLLRNPTRCKSKSIAIRPIGFASWLYTCFYCRRTGAKLNIREKIPEFRDCFKLQNHINYEPFKLKTKEA